MVGRSSTASDTKSPKASGKAGGQKSFEDELHSGKKSRNTSVKTAEDSTSTEDASFTETTSSDISNDHTGSEIMSNKDNAAVTETADNDAGKAPEDAEFNEIQGDDETGSTGIEALTSKTITVDEVLRQAGTDIMHASPDQLESANTGVEKMHEDGVVSLDSIRNLVNDVVQKSDGTTPQSTAVAVVGGRGRKSLVSQAESAPVSGKVMTQRDFYRAILESENCWVYLKFGRCVRPFKITKREAQQVAATVMSYDTPADHDMDCFAEVRLGGLFIGNP